MLKKSIKKFKDFNKKEKPYIYDRGFGDRYYICQHCDSYKLVAHPKGGFQPPEYKCDDCGKTSYAPIDMTPSVYNLYIKEKELKKKIKKYNI